MAKSNRSLRTKTNLNKIIKQKKKTKTKKMKMKATDSRTSQNSNGNIPYKIILRVKKMQR